MSAFDEALALIVARLLDERIAELRAPEMVTQRSVTDVCGMPPRDFLAHCRAGDWPSWADRRLRYARTADVIQWIEARPTRASLPAPSSEFSRSRSGLKRVA